MWCNNLLIICSLFIFIIGLFIFLKPALAIKLQIRFYEKINWRMEPINMQMEIRNSRIMGVFLFLAAVTIIICVIRCSYF